jgi:hypothetical protein
MSVKSGSLAEQFNRNCDCELLDREALGARMDSTAGAPVSPAMFSPFAVFVSPVQVEQMRGVVEAITRTVRLPRYQHDVLAQSPAIARHDPGVEGVFLGFDFHLSQPVPQLIEINTNAGGAFLNVAARAHYLDCCPPTLDPAIPPPTVATLEADIHAMFVHEWTLARGPRPLRTIAIVDENPTQQFLFPEFQLARDLLERHGIRVVIADPSELSLRDDELHAGHQAIDLVYNRLTDFHFEDPRHHVLRDAYRHDVAVVTPHPRAHALWADKRNLARFTDAAYLRDLGVGGQDIEVMTRGIPRTLPVDGPAERWWTERKQWFFKPRSGYGSRGAYRGDKLTRRVFEEIVASDYIAQRIAPPSERTAPADHRTNFKFDVRCYVYGGRIQLLAARLFQGQTTNFRTPGGGFAPIRIVG